MAFLAALRAFSKGLEREALVAELERLARAAGSFDDLAEVYEEAAGETPPGDAARQLWLRRAAELQEQVGQGDEAVRLWQLLLEEAPQDHDALDALSRLFERNKNARELSEVYARQAQLAAEPAERRALLMKAAEAYEEAGAEAEAIDALRSALAIDRTADALGALDRLYARTHEVDAQADVLEQLAQLAADGESRRGHLLRRAQLLEREGRADRALQAWAALLADDGHDAQAVGGLERLLTEEAQRAEAARLLEPVYREARDHKKLVEVLDLRLQQAAPHERQARLDEIATLREALGQKAQAFTARLRAFTEFYANEETHDELERVAADTGSFEEVAAAYEDALERGASAQVAENLWRRLAYLYAERLNRLDDAARSLEEVSRRAPGDLAVLESLGHVYQRAHAFRELAQVMQRRVASEPSEDCKVQLLFELVQLAEETLSDKALAIQAGQGVLALRPEDGAAIKLLARLYSETERHEDLAQLLEREIRAGRSARRARGAVRADGPPRAAAAQPPGRGAQRARALQPGAGAASGTPRRGGCAGGAGPLRASPAGRGRERAGARLRQWRRAPQAGADAGVAGLGGALAGQPRVPAAPDRRGLQRGDGEPGDGLRGRHARAARAARRSREPHAVPGPGRPGGRGGGADLRAGGGDRARRGRGGTSGAPARAGASAGPGGRAGGRGRHVAQGPRAQGFRRRGAQRPGHAPARAGQDRGARGHPAPAGGDERGPGGPRLGAGAAGSPAGGDALRFRRRPGEPAPRAGGPSGCGGRPGAAGRALHPARALAGAGRRAGPPHRPVLGGGGWWSCTTAWGRCGSRASPIAPARWSPTERPSPEIPTTEGRSPVSRRSWRASRRTCWPWSCTSAPCARAGTSSASVAGSSPGPRCRRIPPSASRCWPSWPGCARRRGSPSWPSSPSGARTRRTPTTARCARRSSPPPRPRSPTTSWWGRWRRPCRASTIPRRPPRCASSWDGCSRRTWRSRIAR